MGTLALCFGAAMIAGAVTYLVVGHPSGSTSIVAMLWVLSGSIWASCGLIVTTLERQRHHKRPNNDTGEIGNQEQE